MHYLEASLNRALTLTLLQAAALDVVDAMNGKGAKRRGAFLEMDERYWSFGLFSGNNSPSKWMGEEPILCSETVSTTRPTLIERIVNDTKEQLARQKLEEAQAMREMRELSEGLSDEGADIVKQVAAALNNVTVLTPLKGEQHPEVEEEVETEPPLMEEDLELEGSPPQNKEIEEEEEEEEEEEDFVPAEFKRTPPAQIDVRRPSLEVGRSEAVDAFLTFVGSSSPHGVMDSNFAKCIESTAA